MKKKDTTLKKEKKRPIIYKKRKYDYDEFGDHKNQKIDYEKDKPPHW
jgi:hypothetical protein